jgi:hypothetical protein
MIRYQLPSDLTRDQFHSLVTDIYYEVTTNGLDPVFNMVVGDRDEILDDGTTVSEFAILISESAAMILDHKGH